jgi:allantoinase
MDLYRGQRVLLDDELVPASILVENGKVKEIFRGVVDGPSSVRDVVDCGNLVLMPGLVDSHVHVNEPGPRTNWEGFETATAAAAAGGITTIVDMPVLLFML